MKLLIQLALWIIIAVLGYLLFQSVYEPTKFNEIKDQRYAMVIEKLKDIRTAELAHLEITGKFNGSFDSLSRFVDTAHFAITQRRDTSFADVAKNKAFGIKEGYYIEKVLIDTLDFVSVKDSLFKNSERYKNLDKLVIADKEATIELQAGFVTKNDRKIAVFEAKINKDNVLHDLSRDLVIQEKQTVSVDGINGTHISVGSMTDVNTNGNWPKKYDSPQEQQ
ncbi:MAG: hypothetical protein COS19_02565 [Flavobacteriaceae bacterium CG02_land_8_20_14_3_00_34_13]|nr:hypothetical protein [Flavobacteriia bacterium]PIV51064.1 MAG: hypothetical protein COS19_02565 [Flavobacteriaceae bacterium CG02_land_8_20_14_3_00_34_13]PIZ07315.1 MAG: hypothetical protein COY56_09660 [Flavobacteriaceae bacterium CG_4_10_14_0_8_um_filter_34_31]PJC08110.1 MAG: hypothetical protein CO068_02645 [Flavobacteriaceae bacterium CG_4_9_14_0_8_um_filter_34_30]